MHWRTSNLWKAGIVVAGTLLLLVLMTWVPVSAAGAHRGASEPTTPGTVTVQATPTEDAAVTALNKEMLQHENDWWWNYGATVLTSLISTLTLAAAGIFTVVRYFNDRRDAREKQEAEAKRLAEDRKAERERRDEEQQRWLKDQESEREKRAEGRFQAAVEGLSGEREEARVGAAILLRTFLHPGYEQFYTQTFDLAVANLRLRHLDPAAPEPLTSLSQALIIVFKESFPLARERLKQFPQFLDASCVQLDKAHLADADLQQAWLPEASLRNTALRSANCSEANFYMANLSQADLRKAILTKTNLYKAHLVGTNLSGADLSLADLRGANLSGADLKDASLSGADLKGASLSKADLKGASLTGATLWDANLTEANFKSAKLIEADLRGAKLTGATLWYTDLTGATLHDVDLTDVALWGTNLTEADLYNADLSKVKSWEKADLRRVKGLTSEQLAKCEKDGAINVEYPATKGLLQSLFVTPSPERNPDTQSSSTPDTQGSTPHTNPSGNGPVPSLQEPES